MKGPTSIYDGPLVLVNATHPFIAPAPDDLVSLTPESGICLRHEAAKALTRLLAALDCNGAILPVSGYRSNDEQRHLYEASLRDNGVDFTRRFVAAPGTSEHETGLAIDLALNQPPIDPICPSFPYEGICQQFRALAPRYGFIERYPADKEALTGIAHEPWHFRYVGTPHARLIHLQGFCLEEYLSWLHRYTPDRPLRVGQNHLPDVLIGFLLPTDAERLSGRWQSSTCRISGTGSDGYIVTFSEASHD